MSRDQRQNEEQTVRLMAFEIGRHLTDDEIDQVGGGTTSCSGGKADDCDVAQF